MIHPLRYAWDASGLTPDPRGSAVMFSDVEEALRDSRRLRWLLPILNGAPGRLPEARFDCLAAAHSIGLRGNHMVDWAMEGCPL